MAQTSYQLNDPEDMVKWSKKLNREAIQRTLFLSKFSGTDKNMPIQIIDDLSDGGSQVHHFLRLKGTGAGRAGDDTLEGHGERLTTHRDTIVINQLRHLFEDGGRMSQQRVSWNVRNEGKDALADWWSDRLDLWCANVLSGNTIETDVRYTGMQAVTAATTIRRAAGAASDQALTSSDIIVPADIDWMVNKAQIMSPPIRPVSIDGQDHYILVIHSNVLRQMRSVSGEFHAVWKAAMQGGIVSDNPILNGATMVWNNVVIYVNNRMPQGIDATGTPNVYDTDVRASVFMGAQAAGMAFGRGFGKNRFSYAEESFDLGNQYGVAAGLIAGLKKAVFNSADFGVIRYASWAPDPA
jgi:N4-gp56 family major capsid protein